MVILLILLDFHVNLIITHYLTHFNPHRNILHEKAVVVNFIYKAFQKSADLLLDGRR